MTFKFVKLAASIAISTALIGCGSDSSSSSNEPTPHNPDPVISPTPTEQDVGWWRELNNETNGRTNFTHTKNGTYIISIKDANSFEYLGVYSDGSFEDGILKKTVWLRPIKSDAPTKEWGTLKGEVLFSLKSDTMAEIEFDLVDALTGEKITYKTSLTLDKGANQSDFSIDVLDQQWTNIWGHFEYNGDGKFSMTDKNGCQFSAIARESGFGAYGLTPSSKESRPVSFDFSLKQEDSTCEVYPNQAGYIVVKDLAAGTQLEVWAPLKEFPVYENTIFSM